MQIYFKNKVVERSKLQGLGAVCMYLASKYTQVKKLEMADIFILCNGNYTYDELI